MKLACKIGVIVFGALYLVALALLAIGTVGLFGSERDPLSAVFLLPLGLPWNLLLDGFSDALKPWLAMAAPLVNLAILVSLCRLFGRTSQQPR